MLNAAVNQGHGGVVEVLLAKGADVSLKLPGGVTALNVAKTENIRTLLRAARAN